MGDSVVKYEIGQIVEQRVAFGEALVELAEEFPNLLVLDPDVATSSQTEKFKNKYPDRFIETGIAEQNMVGIAAGLSTVGFIPFASAFAVFLAHRSGDQVRNSVAHPMANVKLNGCYGGLPTGRAGATHSAFEDIAIMRALPNMIVLDPADATEVRLFARLALEQQGPVYLRTVRCGVPVLFGEDHRAGLGKAVWLKKGERVSIISTGMMTARTIAAAKILERSGVSPNLIHMPCLKPIDREAVIEAARTGRIVTVENHSVIGGLGSAVAEITSESAPCLVERIGFQDIFLESGDDEELFDRYGLSERKIAETILGFFVD
jgi:transketolase